MAWATDSASHEKGKTRVMILSGSDQMNVVEIVSNNENLINAIQVRIFMPAFPTRVRVQHEYTLGVAPLTSCTQTRPGFWTARSS